MAAALDGLVPQGLDGLGGNGLQNLADRPPQQAELLLGAKHDLVPVIEDQREEDESPLGDRGQPTHSVTLARLGREERQAFSRREP